MKIDVIKKSELRNYILSNLSDCRMKTIEISGAKYHHNISYESTPLALRNGILSLKERAKLNNRELTTDELYRNSDDGHVNGIDYVSVSTPDIDYSRLYRDEFVYDSTVPYAVDICISSGIPARRNSDNYANEYLVDKGIKPEHFRAVDIRILNYLKESLRTEVVSIDEVLKRYNLLSNIANALIDEQLDIPFREMSEGNIILDPTKVANLNILALKR